MLEFAQTMTRVEAATIGRNIVGIVTRGGGTP